MRSESSKSVEQIGVPDGAGHSRQRIRPVCITPTRFAPRSRAFREITPHKSPSIYPSCPGKKPHRPSDFLLEGIPASNLWVDITQYRQVHHQASDTFDKVDANSFRAGGAVVARTRYAVANQRNRIARSHRAGRRSSDPAHGQTRRRLGVILETTTRFATTPAFAMRHICRSICLGSSVVLLASACQGEDRSQLTPLRSSTCICTLTR